MGSSADAASKERRRPGETQSISSLRRLLNRRTTISGDRNGRSTQEWPLPSARSRIHRRRRSSSPSSQPRTRSMKARGSAARVPLATLAPLD